jgi:branched-chain amino acid transport system ATP-binding protein
MKPLLITKNLSKHFDGLRAVNDANFTLPGGEIRAVIGPNGAGKTTFVNMISGRTAPSAGSIFFDGQDITDLPAHRRVRLGIAYTFQITSVFANLSAYDNVALAVQRELAGGSLDHEIMSALERTGLASHARTQAGNLAYGHQRLLEVAMGLALKPRLLILDEPTQGFSDGEIETFIELVREIARDATIMLIEHNMQVVMALADRITVFESGSILAEGIPSEIRKNEAVQRAYLGSTADG